MTTEDVTKVGVEVVCDGNKHIVTYSWNYPDGDYPTLHRCVSVGRTLAVGSMTRMRLSSFEFVATWSDSKKHMIVFDCALNHVAIPSTLSGRLLRWLADRSVELDKKFDKIDFWMFRKSEDEWVWFLDKSPEALAYLPWLHREAEKEVKSVMDL